jgi:hypothetical protein
MPFKPLPQTIKNQINLFSHIIKHGKNTSKDRHCNKTTYKLIDKWERKGFLLVEKKGRELLIEPTKKGNEYFQVMSEIVPYLDFFD